MNVFEKAVEIIEVRGWTQRQEIDEQGRVCALGALGLACGGEEWESLEGTWAVVLGDNIAGRRLMIEAQNFLQSQGFTGGDWTGDWNDQPSRTKEEVIQTLEEAATRWEATHS